MARPRLIHLADAAAALGRRRRRRGTPHGVLLIAAGGLGDTVLFARVVARFGALARRDEPVTVLLRRDAGAMAFVLGPEVAVETADFGRLRRLVYRTQVMRRLHRSNYRLVVSTDFMRHPHLDEALVRAAAAPESAAMEPRSWPRFDAQLKRNRALYGRLFDSGPARRDKVLRWCAFADWLGDTTTPLPPARLPEERFAAPAALGQPCVLVQPFSAVRAKQCPPALFARLIQSLPPDHRVIVAGAPGDLERNPDYASLMAPPRVVFDGSPFEDLVPVLRAVRLVVSVDTALMHLAIAVGAPTLGLASAAFVGEIVPYAAEVTPGNAHFMHVDMPCEGCLGNCVHPLEAGMFRCVAGLDADAVATRAGAMLAEGRA